jgi:acetate kinase
MAMPILVLNSGSSSLKYQLLDMEQEQLIAKGLVQRIGSEKSSLTHKVSGKEDKVIEKHILDHAQAIYTLIEVLTDPEDGLVKDAREIVSVGHRVVHGGESFSESVPVTSEVLDTIYDMVSLAPLHNPPNIKGIEACMEVMPESLQVAVFDTAFHQSIEPHAFLYALPYDLYKKHGIRRYGFHGTSHRYVARQAAEILKESVPPENQKIVTCHLGNGASIAAVRGGKSVDTSMGLTPLEGLLMGTRCGDVDPGAILYIMKREKLSLSDVDTLMNKHSGLYGISGLSNDMREVEDQAEKGDYRCKLALDIFSYRIKKYIMSYAGAMGGLDAVVFTGGVGENSPEIREMSIQGLEFAGISLDAEKNRNTRGNGAIHAGNSKVQLLVIATNEELVIARDAKEVYLKEKQAA